jgi:hypothetical protein
MESAYSPVVLSNSVVFKTIAVDAINIAYREAGDPTHPKLVLLQFDKYAKRTWKPAPFLY